MSPRRARTELQAVLPLPEPHLRRQSVVERTKQVPNPRPKEGAPERPWGPKRREAGAELRANPPFGREGGPPANQEPKRGRWAGPGRRRSGGVPDKTMSIVLKYMYYL